jgi:protein-S-isoprenylcysteine O-methyltransferase Ste14
MNEEALFNYFIIGWFVLALTVFISLFFFVAPYGRYVRKGWGLTIGSRNGWLLMEAIAPLVLAACFLLGSNPYTGATVAFLVMWEAHYIHRAFIYPFSRRDWKKPMPVAVVAMALIYNMVNGYLNGRHIFSLSTVYTNEWLIDPRFLVGVGLFIAGFVINRHADHTLHKLRRQDETSYKVPQGGLFRWISSPNYLGEIILWIGWAIATWSLPGLAFAIWTMANLIPRARSNHRWYREHFPEYPPGRRSLLPGIW